MFKFSTLASIVIATQTFAQVGNHLDSFLELNPNTSFFYNNENKITRVYGQPFSSGNSAIDSADSFVEAWAGIWNCQTNDFVRVGPWGDGNHVQPMMYKPDTDSYKFTGVGYLQTVNGIPVYGSRLTVLVRNDSNFPAVHVSANLYDVSHLKNQKVKSNPNIIRNLCIWHRFYHFNIAFICTTTLCSHSRNISID